jgi:hypothetical protein
VEDVLDGISSFTDEVGPAYDALAALKERAARAERERDAARAAADEHLTHYVRLETALREIRMCSDDERVVRIARAALADAGGEQ